MARLRLRHLLVTGGAGFIGSAFVRERLRADPEIRLSVLDKLTYAGSEENLGEARNDQRLRFVQGDISDRGALHTLFQVEKFDAVAHFAALIEAGESMTQPSRYFRHNVGYTQTLLEAMLAPDRLTTLVF